MKYIPSLPIRGSRLELDKNIFNDTDKNYAAWVFNYCIYTDNGGDRYIYNAAFRSLVLFLVTGRYILGPKMDYTPLIDSIFEHEDVDLRGVIKYD